MKKILFLFLSVFLSLSALAQNVLTGTVKDAVTGEMLPFVNIYYSASDGTQSTISGDYKIPKKKQKLTFSLLGYKTLVTRVGNDAELHVKLEPLLAADEKEEAVVTAKREKYSRKNNPAVELMKKVIAHKSLHDLHKRPFFSFDKYTRTTFALNEVTDKVFDEGALKKFAFLKNHVETSNETGTLILPITVDEVVTQHIFRQEPRAEKTIVKGKRTEGLSELFATGDLFNTVVKDIFTEVNIYDDDVRLLQFPFTSPISSRAAINFYRYFLVDTVMVDSTKAIEVNFTPNNPQDFGFSGALWVALDSTFRVLKVDMGIPKRSDVNWVENMRIIQEFRRLPSGEQVLVKDNMVVQLKIVDFVQKAMVKRVTDYSRFTFDDIPEKTFKFKGNELVESDALMRSADFWEAYRPDPLSETESQLGTLVNQLGKVKSFRYVLWVAKAFIENFVETSTNPKKPSKVDIGPVNTMFTQNFVDGFRLRLSAQTTAALNPHFFLKGYAAYGFQDKRFKGMAEATYSLLPKAFLPREFPVHNITASYAYDVMSPSDKFMPTDKDNVFTSFKWTTVDHMMYYKRFLLTYDREWYNNLRLKLQLRHEQNEPTAALFYQTLDGKGTPTNDPALWKRFLRTTDATIALEYQPGAKWINTKQRRYKPNFDNPIYTLSHTSSFKGFLGSDYAYNLTELSAFKRVWLGSWGKMDLQLKAGAEWNKVPFPLLIMPAANLSFIIEDNTFNLIDNMEFLNDRYASFMGAWDLNGKIFNRIPLIKKLKWREYLGVNVLWGDLTSKNNPFLAKNAADPTLFYFPGRFNADGSFTYLSRPMEAKKPYVEVMAGIHNIFKVFHIEYVRRLTYTEHQPQRRLWGIRAMFRVTF